MWRRVCLALCFAGLPAQDAPDGSATPAAPVAATLRVTVPLHDNHLDVAELVRALLAAYELDGDAFDLPTARIDLSGAKGTLLLYAGRKLLLGTVLFRRNFRAQQLVVTIDRERAREVRRLLRTRLAGFAGQLAGVEVESRRYELTLPAQLDATLPLVVLVHGVEGDAEDFRDLRPFLAQRGSQVATFEYANDEGGERVAAELGARLRGLGQQPIALVGHSFGGLVARAVVEDPKLDPGNVRTLVQLGAPNLGSELAAFRFALEAYDALVGKDAANLFAQNLLDAVIDHWRDGLGEAGGDLSPGSVFLTRLAARPRNPRVDYHAVAGTRSLLNRDQLAVVRDEVKRRLDDTQLGQLVRPRLERWLSDLDEVVDGEGDGAVGIASARLEGAENVRVPLDHLGLVRQRGLLAGVERPEDHPVFERIAAWVGPALTTELSGRVVDVLGDPVPAAQVWLMRDDDTVLRRTVADAEGLFRLRLPAVRSRVRVHAEAPGCAMAPVPLTSPNLVLVLRDAGVVTGVVRDDAGQPVVGADVVTSTEFGFAAFATSDASGAFRFGAVPLGAARLQAWSEGRSHEPVAIDLRVDSSVDLQLVGPAVRPRLVVAADLTPATRACASFGVTSKLPLPPRMRRMPLRADGTVLLPPLPVGHEVALLVPGVTVEPELIRCVAGASEDLEVRAVASWSAARPARSAAGRIVDGAGIGIPNVCLAIADLRERPLGATRTSSDGSFQFALPGRGGNLVMLGVHVGDRPVRNRVDAFGWQWTSVTIDEAPIELRLDGGGAIDGVVAVRGTPMTFGDITWMRVGGARERPSAGGTTDGRGRLHANGLEPGCYRVTVVAVDGTVAQTEAVVQAGHVTPIGAFAVQPSGSIEGRLLDDGGQPVPGARYWLGQRSPQLDGPLGRSGITNRDGRFRVRGLLPGDYAVRHEQVGAPGAPVKFVPLNGVAVQVLEGAATEVELKAPR